jgi:hypothetical protein
MHTRKLRSRLAVEDLGRFCLTQLGALWLAPAVGALIAGAKCEWLTGEYRAHLDIEGATGDVENAVRDPQGRAVLVR